MTALLPSLATVVVLTYNGQQWIQRCLDSVIAATGSCAQILVVDNASTDDTHPILKRAYPSVPCLTLPKNVGFSAGVNAGIREALRTETEYIILLNQDTHVQQHWLHELLRTAENLGRIGVFSPLELTYDGGGIDPTNKTNLAHHLPQFIDDLWKRSIKEAYRIDMVFGGAMMVHRQVFEKIGLFDELFFMYCEDIDFCRRVVRAGIPIWFVPSSQVHHWSTMSSVSGYANDRVAKHNRRGWMLLGAKSAGRSLARSMISEILRALLRIVLSPPERVVRSAADAAQDIGWLLVNTRRIAASRHYDRNRLYHVLPSSRSTSAVSP